jgi:hypothetical protein
MPSDRRLEIWPSLPYKAWKETCTTLHLWTQIVGKIRLVKMPWVNHSWHVTLYVTHRGLTTSANSCCPMMMFDPLKTLTPRCSPSYRRPTRQRQKPVVGTARGSSVPRYLHGHNKPRMSNDLGVSCVQRSVEPALSGRVPDPWDNT